MFYIALYFLLAPYIKDLDTPGKFGGSEPLILNLLIFLDAPLPAANPWKKSVSPDPVPVQAGSDASQPGTPASQPGAGTPASQPGTGAPASKPVPREKKGESVNSGKQVIVYSILELDLVH